MMNSEISKNRIENWFLLAAYSTMWDEREGLSKKLLSKDDLGLDDLGNSQPFQTAKIRRITCSREKANTGQPFASISEGLKFQSIPSHRVFFERLGIWHGFPSFILAEVKNRDGITQERSVEEPLV